MSKVLSRLSTATLLLFMASSANAMLVTETWESTITDLNHTAFSIGDTFSWTVTYDDQSERTVQYNDGLNGTAEAGGGDDTYSMSWCTESYSGPEACTTTWNAEFLFASDAVFDLSEFTSVMTAAGLMGYDVLNTNSARAWDHTTNGQLRFLYADDLMFGTADARSFYPTDTQLGYYVATTAFTSEIIETTRQGGQEVPEPTVITLLLIGLVGIAFSQKQRKSPPLTPVRGC